MAEPSPLDVSDVEKEAERCRDILDNLPKNEDTDMLYAAYNALLFVLGYGVAKPSILFGGGSAEEKRRHLRGLD